MHMAELQGKVLEVSTVGRCREAWHMLQVPKDECNAVAADEAAGKPRYKNATEAYRRILAEEGFIGGLYRGYFPNLIRNSVISATELVSSGSKLSHDPSHQIVIRR